MLQFPCQATSWQCVLYVATDLLLPGCNNKTSLVACCVHVLVPAISEHYNFSHLHGKEGTWCLKTAFQKCLNVTKEFLPENAAKVLVFETEPKRNTTFGFGH